MRNNSFSGLVFLVIVGIGLVLAYALYSLNAIVAGVLIGGIGLVIAVVVSSAIKVANQWERAVVLAARSLPRP